MKQVLSIFSKDIRHLWPSISIVILPMVLHAVHDVRTWPTVGSGESVRSTTVVLGLLLPLAIWFLIAQAVFQESLPGDRQYWLTRPYGWKRLLMAKILFFVAFINVPFFLSDCCILGVQGLPLLHVFPQLLLRQAIIAAIYILPSLAIATVTSGLGQFVLAWLFIAVVTIFGPFLISSRGNSELFVVNWSAYISVVLIVVGCGIVFWQYARRSSVAAKLALFAVVCAVWPLMDGMYAMGLFHPAEDKMQEPPEANKIRLAYDPTHRDFPGGGSGPFYGSNMLRIPITVSGLRPGTELFGTSAVTIEADGKTRPESGGFYAGSLARIGGYYWPTLNLDRLIFEKLKKQPVHLHVVHNLDLLADEVEATVPMTKSSFSVPGVGVCHAALDVPQLHLTCRAGLTARAETVVRVEPPESAGDLLGDLTFPEYSTPWSLSPTTDLGANGWMDVARVRPDTRLAFVRRQKLGRLKRSLDLRDVRLGDFSRISE